MIRILALVSGATLVLAAQNTPDVLAHLPAQAKSYQYFPHPRRSTEAFQATAAAFSPRGAKVRFTGEDLERHWGLELDREPGEVLAVECDSEEGVPSRMLIFAPKDPQGVLVRLKARKDAEGWSYATQAKGKKPGSRRHASLRDGLLVLADRKVLLNVGEKEDSGALRAWIAGSDMVMGVPRKALATELNQARMAMNVLEAVPEGAQPGTNKKKQAEESAAFAAARPTMEAILPLVIKLQTSADGAALALSFRPEGVQVKGQVFFKPGSPMASETVPTSSSLLMGLPDRPSILVAGMNATVLQPFQARTMGFVRGQAQGKVDANTLKRWEEVSTASTQSLRSMAMQLALPAQAGAPLLSGTTMVFQVEDAARAMALMAEAQELNAQVMKALPLGATLPMTKVERDLLPGIPSLGVSMDLAALGGEAPLPPEAVGIFTMLLGGNQFRISYAALGDRALLAVLGDKEALKAALAEAQAASPLAESERMKAALAGFPAGCFLQMCFSPQQLGQSMKTFLTSMGAPKVPEFPNLSGELIAAGFHTGPQGMGFRALASQAAIQDLGIVIKAMESLAPKRPLPASKGRSKTKG